MDAKNYFPGKRGKVVFFYFSKNESDDSFTAYYPLRIVDKASENLAKAYGYDIRKVSLGKSPVRFRAVMVPCIPTYKTDGVSPKEQIHFALQLSSDDIREQQDNINDTRCLIPSQKGLWKRCPYAVKSEPNSSGNKTKRTCCDGTGRNDACPFVKFKTRSPVSTFSDLAQENENGDYAPFDVASPVSPNESYRYQELSQRFLNYVKDRKPRLLDLAKLLLEGFSYSEAEKELGRRHSTIWSQIQHLKDLALDFISNVATV